MAGGGHSALQACEPDIAKLCSNVQPGGGKIKESMKEHVHDLSPPCKEALFQIWLKQ